MHKRSIHHIFWLVVLGALLFAGSCSDNPTTTEQPTGSEPVATTEKTTTNPDASTPPPERQQPQPDKTKPKPPLNPDPLSEAELKKWVTALASDDLKGRAPGTPGAEKARKMIIDRLKECGVRSAGTVGFEQKIGNTSGVNIMGSVFGTDPKLKDRYILLSAHYDHLGERNGRIYNGANDNAAAVAIILAVICHVAHTPLKRSVIFASWDAEEPPHFLKSSMGSLHYVNNPIIPLEKTDVSVVLDLVGADLWKGFSGHFLLGSELSPEVSAVLKNTKVPNGLNAYHAGLHLVEQTPLGMQPWSDYHGFRQKNVPVLFLSNGQNKQYHTPQDITGMLNLPGMAIQAKYLMDLIKNLGNADKTPTFNPSGKNYLRDAENMLKVMQKANDPNTGIAKALNLNQQSVAKLKSDLARLTAIRNKLAGGGTLTTSELTQLRTPAQRLMCYAGTAYRESTCNIFP